MQPMSAAYVHTDEGELSFVTLMCCHYRYCTYEREWEGIMTERPRLSRPRYRRAGPRPPRIRSHCRFRNKGTEYVSEYGISCRNRGPEYVKESGGNAGERQCKATMRPSPTPTIVTRLTKVRGRLACRWGYIRNPIVALEKAATESVRNFCITWLRCTTK